MINYPVVFNENIKLQIFENEFLLARKEFLEIYAFFLRKELCKNWQIYTRKCIKIWIAKHSWNWCVDVIKNCGLEWDCLSEYIAYSNVNDAPGTLSDIVTFLQIEQLPFDVCKHLICERTKTKWNYLTDIDRDHIKTVLIDLINRNDDNYMQIVMHIIDN